MIKSDSMMCCQCMCCTVMYRALFGMPSLKINLDLGNRALIPNKNACHIQVGD